MPKTSRKNVAKKMSAFIKTAQAEELPEAEDLEMEDTLEVKEVEEGEDLEELEEEEAKDIGVLEEKVDDIDEKLDDVVDALEDNKEVLEKALLGEENFEDFKEKKEDEDEEEFTVEEFGFDVGSTEENEPMKTSNLRKLRNARLLKALKKNYVEDKTLNEEWNEPASTSKKTSPQSPAVTISNAPQKDEVPEMLKLAELSLKSTKNSWTVVNANGKALYSIPQGDMDKKEFASKKFAEKVIKEMSENGIGNTLKKYKATKVKEAKTEKKATKEPVKEKAVNKVSDKQVQANVRRRFLRAVRLALQAMNKNLVKQAPLKKALFDVMDGIGIDQAQQIIEVAFAKSAAEHFEVAIDQAEKYMDMSDEAFVEVESSISDSEVYVPTVEEISDEMKVSAQLKHQSKLRQRAVSNSLRLSTESSENLAGDRMDQLSKVLPKPSLFSLKGLG